VRLDGTEAVVRLDGTEGVVTIDCDECVMAGTAACDDCVVSFVVGRRRDEAIVIDASERRVVRLLADVGLVPDLRHQRRVG
jgi:tartrate dehydratase alpha subunit/fumarate hydratase class I-like protein